MAVFTDYISENNAKDISTSYQYADIVTYGIFN